MTDHDDEVQHRVRHTAPAETITVRQVPADDADGQTDQFVVRMPITSTAEARDGVAFDRDKVEGFVEQLRASGMGAFIDHGRNDQTGHRYSALGKVGRVAEPELVDRDGATDLDVDFRFPMPDAVADDADTLREILATLLTQARAGIPLTSSIGWSEETGERDLPGDADLLEASIVGIPSDARTTTDQASAEPALARAVTAASSDFDVDRFVRELQRQAEGVETVQVPEYDDAANPDNVSWDGLDLEDFEGDVSATDPVVYNKFLHSESGFPPAEDAAFDSLSFPVVDTDGTLLLQALEDALGALPAGDLTDEEREALQAVIVDLAASEFPDADLGENSTTDTDTHDMTDETDESGSEPDDTNDDDSDGISADEFRERMLELQEQQMDTLDTVAEAVRQSDEDDQPGGDEDDEGDDEEDDEEDMEESAADTDDADTRTIDVDGTEMTVAEARDHIADLRDEAAETTADDVESKTQDRVSDGDADERDTDADADSDTSGIDWRA